MKSYTRIWSLIRKVYPSLGFVSVVIRTLYFSLVCSKAQKSVAIRYLEAISCGYYVNVVVSFSKVLSEDVTTDRVLRTGSTVLECKFGAPVIAVDHKKCYTDVFHYAMEPDATFIVKDTSIAIKEGTLVACKQGDVIDLNTGLNFWAERKF